MLLYNVVMEAILAILDDFSDFKDSYSELV